MREPVPRGLITALELLRAPAMADVLRQQSALPDDIGILIRVAGGCEATRQRLAVQLNRPEAHLIKAARFYLEQVLFYSETDSYRVLGVASDAPQATVQAHGRWLLKWLHPDNDHTEWEATFAGRVTAAWNDLKTPERRAAYDRKLRSERARAFHRRKPAHLAPPLFASQRSQSDATRRRRRLIWRVAAAAAIFLAAWLVPLDFDDTLPGDQSVASCVGQDGAGAVACKPATGSPDGVRLAEE